MSWIQQNKVPAAIIGVSVAGAAGLGFMLFSAYSSYSTTLEQFDSVNNSLASLKSAVLAPTPENVALKQGLVKEFTDASGRLSLVLKTLQIEDKPTTDTEFQAKLKTKIADSRKTAAEKGMALPAVYNLAFDRYTSALPKSNEEATVLSGYLDAVDQIVNTFASVGVKQLEMLERSELDSEKSEPTKPSKPAPKKAGPAGRPAAPVAPKLSERRQVRALLTLDQAALQQLMSSLASPSEMPYFTVVRLLRIENERQEGPLRSEMTVFNANPNSDPGADAPQPIVEGQAPKPEATTAKAAPVDAVAVLGNEKLKVFLEIDLVYFLNAQTASTGTR